MSNDNFMIQMTDLNSAAGNPSSSNFKLDLTVGDTTPGLYTGTNYKIRSGFQYVSLTTPFSFSISQTLVDFGILSPTNPVTRSHTISISNSSGYGYEVTALENHPLQNSSKEDLTAIPDTSCDDGTCNETNASNWQGILTFGFGFRCDNLIGTDCASDFLNTSFFRQFADASKAEIAQPVLKGAVAGGKKAQITYKVNVSGTQAAGTYSNAITYIATPTF